MSEIREKYFTTGEFARICNVPKHVLFHYDEIGLFHPAIVKDNQYRYYSSHQYDTFSIILVLKSIGMSLQDIKIYLEKRTPEFLIDLLNDQEKVLDMKIKKLKHAKEFINSIRSTTSKALDVDTQDINLQYCEEEMLLCSDDHLHHISKDFTAYADEYIHFYAEYLDINDKVGTMLSIKDIQNENYNYFQCLFTRTKNHHHKNVFIKPAGHYLVTYHRGSYKSVYLAYQKLLDYAKQHQLTLGEKAYEDYILSDIAVKNEEDFITMISLEIK